MDNKKLEPIIAGVLVFLVLAGFMIAHKTLTRRKNKQVSAANGEEVDQESYDDFFAGRNEGYDLDDQIVTSSSISRGGLYVESITTEPQEQVVIGGKTYVIGDKIGKYKIVVIREDVVIITDGKNTHELSLGQSLGD